MQENKKQAVIYCRVSTKEQVEEGNSLVTQERNCREYALKYGYDIARIFIEQGESAKTADRTELKKLFSFCANKKNNIQAIIAYKIDRISRNTDDYSQIRILLKRYGVEIKSTSEYFEDTPAGRFMENIIANVAQFDNDVRAERSSGGMKDAVREGRYVWMAPIGYSNVKIDGKATIAPSEKAVLIKQVFGEIIKQTNTVEQIRKMAGAWGLNGKKGKLVAKSYFYRVIRNELYCGWINKFGERHKGVFKPIISEEEFNIVQQILKKQNKTRPYLRENSDFPLRRFIKHPSGEKLTGSWSKGKYNRFAYYRFIKAGIGFTKAELEGRFLSYLNTFALSTQWINFLKKRLGERLQTKSEGKKKEQLDLIVLSESLKKRKQELLDLQSRGIINDYTLKEQLEMIDESQVRISSSIQVFTQKEFTLGALFEYITDFLISPASFHNKLPFDLWVKLMWFEFPGGVIFDGNNFRTPEMCSIFKVKDIFETNFSSKVDYRDFTPNTLNQQITAPLSDTDKLVFWAEVEKDLVGLAEILKGDERKDSSTVGIKQK